MYITSQIVLQVHDVRPRFVLVICFIAEASDRTKNLAT